MNKLSFFTLIKLELLAILTNPVVNLTVFGGVLFYSFLYPLPYANQVSQELPISIINLDNSQTSLQLERMVDATPQIHVIQRDHTIAQAKSALINQDIGGFLVIPEDFYKDLLLGKAPTLSYAGDASYFLVYGTVVEGLARAGGTLAAEAKVAHLVSEGSPLSTASHQFSAFTANMKPTFNSRMGYVDYVVPAVFVLILQQTLIMAMGLVGNTQKHSRGYWNEIPPSFLLSVRVLVLLGIYYVLAMYYFGASFEMYGINRLASMGVLLALLFPFLLSGCLIGAVLGQLLPRRELVTVVVLVSSMPLIFLAGFIWPVQMIPEPLVMVSKIFPSTPAIQAFLATNQMGASWSDIADLWSLMWAQVIGWAIVTWLVFFYSKSKS
ncbi:ABC transporter permease [Vibrio makurazakiensis]|uniref:ABC transporter permease n=1 Tax=Vibrio makurazakiensis TaxID=2910250 RepID=UPI003D132F0C